MYVFVCTYTTDRNNTCLDLIYKTVNLGGPQTKIPSRNVLLSSKWWLKSTQRLHQIGISYCRGDLNDKSFKLCHFNKSSHLSWQSKQDYKIYIYWGCSFSSDKILQWLTAIRSIRRLCVKYFEQNAYSYLNLIVY